MVASYIHIPRQTPSPIPLVSRKPLLPLFNIDFSFYCGKDTNVLPLPLWALECGREFSFLESHSKNVSVQEWLDLAWEVLLCNIRVYQHIDSSYDQGKMDISQTSHIRVWKHHGCRGYTTQWTDNSPNASWVRKAAFAYFQTKLLLQWHEPFLCAASCSLMPGKWNWVAFPQKALQTCSPFPDLWGGMQNNSFPYQWKAAHSLFVQSG